MNYSLSLQNHNLKATPQRLEIIDILYKNGHLSIDELYRSLLKKFPSLSLATVYKNIKIMSDKLFLQEVKIPHKKNVYELSKTEHSHIVCSKCSSIVDIQLDISKILEQATSVSKYKIDKSSIILSGICPKCI